MSREMVTLNTRLNNNISFFLKDQVKFRFMADDCEASQGCMNDGSIYLYPESASSLTLKIEFSVEMD